MGVIDDIVLIVLGIVFLVISGPVGTAIKGEAGNLTALLLRVLGIVFLVVGFILLLLDVLGIALGGPSSH